ncbi:MAG: hypothetical protein II649_11430 [Kiritimatiellae bacterium]|nr:hypothetical protein [Kiritimatiellia bacterium]
MNFKTAIIGIILVASGHSFAEAKKELTPQERAERRSALIARVGGLVPRPGTPSGRIAFVNAQKRIPVDEFKATFAKNATKVRGVDSWVEAESVSVANANTLRKANNAEFAVFIVDVPDLPMSLIAVEEGWAIMNIRALDDGKTKDDLLRHRAKNEFARVYGILCGGASSQFKSQIMNTISKPSDLNGCTDDLPVDVTAKIPMYLEGRGVKSEQLIPYRRAVQEGWAKPPTNDVQKAIWEQVHSIPDKPIKIEFDPKKDK